MYERIIDEEAPTDDVQVTNTPGKDVAIVTGTSRGIGRAIAECLVTEGASVVINYVTNDAAASDVVDAIDATGGDALAVQGDISEADDVKRLFDEETAFGPVDIVVNAAGTSVCGPIAAFTEADFDRVFDVNTKGFFLVLREAANRITDGGRRSLDGGNGARGCGYWSLCWQQSGWRATGNGARGGTR